MIEILRFGQDDISEKVFDNILSHLRNRTQVDEETGNKNPATV
jgi:hypothetical protein